MLLQVAVSVLGGEKDRSLIKLRWLKNIKSKAHRHMHRLMVIGQNINTGTILLVRFITIPAEISIFI
jgi:hypothetical protein